MWCQTGKDPQVVRKRKRRQKHLSNLETNLLTGLVNRAGISNLKERNPDYVFDTANPADSH